MPTNTQLEEAIRALLFDRPIAYHPLLARITGSVNAGVLLSQFLYWTPRTTDPDGWFWKTGDEITDETALTRKEQESARKLLKRSGLVTEVRRGVPARLFYRVDMTRLTCALGEIKSSPNGETGCDQRGNQDPPRGATKYRRAGESRSESTHEMSQASYRGTNTRRDLAGKYRHLIQS